ncbi:hypothetical protein Baya_12131 [Bagarius yarrelli]|uniref:Uncharacterized protein n=1 Tax=Bagarius yarrelli TaxID=175774 RepID=A0A556V2T0_BAGYA|nr:hypothetical protein Baya_12131 [Bagarius yarrelli]
MGTVNRPIFHWEPVTPCPPLRKRRGRLTSLLLKTRSPALWRRSNARSPRFSGSIAEWRMCVVFKLLRSNAPYGQLSQSSRKPW